MPFQLVPTEDGSLSCVDSETGQLSHNRAGAYTESVQLYAKPSGLRDRLLRQGEIRVLDACYGMGYNTWSLINELLRLEEASQFSQPLADESPVQPFTVSLVCIEKYPEVLDFLPQVLNLPTLVPLKSKIAPSEHNAYYRTLTCVSDTKVEGIEVRKMVMDLAPFWRFELELWVDDLRHRASRLEGPFDAVFHDPFSPQKMPELWTADLFSRYFELLSRRRGRLLTYSTAAAVRGGMREAGFEVVKIPGLGSKSGGTLALVPLQNPANSADAPAFPENLIPLEPWESEYLQTRAAIPYRDPGLGGTREQILEVRSREQLASPLPSGSAILKKKRYKPGP